MCLNCGQLSPCCCNVYIRLNQIFMLVVHLGVIWWYIFYVDVPLGVIWWYFFYVDVPLGVIWMTENLLLIYLCV
jgi:hypothetical protein